MKKFLLFSCSILVSLGIVEAMLRVVGISYPVFTTIDPDRGFALAPNAEGWQTAEGRAYIKINNDGLRDDEHSLEKPGDTLRIAVLGDSYAEAQQVPIEHAFWKVFESDLAKCDVLGGRKVEVINFGVGGYGTAQELLTLRRHVWKYDPDIVLLAFLTGNDITDNSMALRKNPTVPYFELKNGKLALDKSFRTSSFDFKLAIGFDQLNRRLNSLRIVQLVQQVRRVLSTWSARSPNEEDSPLARGNLPQGLEDGLDHAIYTSPPDATWAKAWDVTEALLLTMSSEVRAKGADLWIVTLTNGIQVNPDVSVRQAFMQWKQVAHLRYPDLRIRRLAEKNNIPVVTLVDPLAEYAEQKNVYLHGFGPNIGKGHWNKDGHSAAGKEIAASMCGNPSKALLSR